MPELKYEKKSIGRLLQESKIYHVESDYDDKDLMDRFLELKANICDLNPELITAILGMNWVLCPIILTQHTLRISAHSLFR